MPKHFRLLVGIASAVAMIGLAACSHKKGLRITRIDPSSGIAGDTVTIHGDGFQSGGTQGVTVYFGNKKARVLSFQGDHELLVAAPSGVKLGKTVDVLVVFADARSLNYPKAFKYAKASEGFGVGELTSGKTAAPTKGPAGGTNAGGGGAGKPAAGAASGGGAGAGKPAAGAASGGGAGAGKPAAGAASGGGAGAGAGKPAAGAASGGGAGKPAAGAGAN